jgi:hypothetical protein
LEKTSSSELASNDGHPEGEVAAVVTNGPITYTVTRRPIPNTVTNRPIPKKAAYETVPLNFNGKFGYLRLTTAMPSEVQFTLTLRS